MAGIQVTKRVLVVDDVAEMRSLIRRVLSADGYQVDVAATLAEARSMHPAGYSAVLVDAHLGDEQGIDLIEELRSGDPAAAQRCLMITGSLADAGPAGLTVLAKPFRAADLLDAVRALPESAAPQPAPPQPVSPRPVSPQPGAGPESSASPGSSAVPGPSAVPEPASLSASPLSAMPQDDSRLSPAQIRCVLAVVRRLRTRERRELVGFLHDGPIQEITASTLEAEMMRRSAAAGPLPRFDAVLQQLNAAARALRWLVDGEWPFMQPEARLGPALQQRTAWLLAKPLATDIDERCGELGACDVPAVVDVAELMLLGMLPSDCPVRAHLSVRGQPQLIELELTLTPVDGQPMGDPACARTSLDDLAAALGSIVRADFREQRWWAWMPLRGWAG